MTDARDLKRGVSFRFSLEGELPPGVVAMELSSENGWLRSLWSVQDFRYFLRVGREALRQAGYDPDEQD